MPNIAFILTAAFLWTVVTWRADKARRPGTERSLWFVLLMFAASTTVLIDRPWQLANKFLSPLGGAGWVWTCCSVLAAAGARSLVVHTQAERQKTPCPRLHLWLAAAALVIVTLSYIGHPAPPKLDGPSLGFVQRESLYQGGIAAGVRWAVWLGFLTWALTGMEHVTRQYAQHARRATPGRLTTGLRFGAMGCRVGYGYVALKAMVVAAWVGGAGLRLGPVDQVGDWIALLSVALIVVASTYDALLSRARAFLKAVSQLRALRRLRPLWMALSQAAPYNAARIPTSSVRQRLSRRVLDIRDRQLALRPYADPDLPRRALEAAEQAGYCGEQARVLAEATWLESARQAKVHGFAATADVPYDATYEVSGGKDLDEEVTWLLGVADAHRHSSFVRAFVAGRPIGGLVSLKRHGVRAHAALMDAGDEGPDD